MKKLLIALKEWFKARLIIDLIAVSIFLTFTLACLKYLEMAEERTSNILEPYIRLLGGVAPLIIIALAPFTSLGKFLQSKSRSLRLFTYLSLPIALLIYGFMWPIWTLSVFSLRSNTDVTLPRLLLAILLLLFGSMAMASVLVAGGFSALTALAIFRKYFPNTSLLLHLGTEPGALPDLAVRTAKWWAVTAIFGMFVWILMNGS